MSAIDILILIIIAIFVWKGVRLGLIEAVGGLVGLFVGAYAAGRYYEAVAEAFSGALFNSPVFARVIAFILIFIAVNRAIALVFWILDKAFNIIAFIPFLKTFNRLLGGALGLVEALIFIAVLTIFLAGAPFGDNIKSKMEASRFNSLVKTAEVLARPFIPDQAENWSITLPKLPFDFKKNQ